MENHFRCPKCGSDYTTRTPIELLSGVKTTFYLFLFITLFGGAISPVIWLFSLLTIILGVVTNIVKKISHKNHWFMTCQRCNEEFYVVDPDKIDVVQQKRTKDATKQAEKESKKQQLQMEKAKILARNGMVPNGEKLLGEASFFGFHKSAFLTINNKLKVTDKSYIIYNEMTTILLQRENILSITKKNFFFFVPTGIRIKTNDKRKVYNFVVPASERTEIIEKLNSK